MKLVIVTDAWHPQVNGVVRTLDLTASHLRLLGHEVTVVSPQAFYTMPCPTYPEIRLSLTTRSGAAAEIEKAAPDHIHIATEATLGMAARNYCLANNLPFTTSYHTRFPEYVNARFPIPTSWTYAYLRRFHNAGVGCMVATPTLSRDLEKLGFFNLKLWSRGVDADLYTPEKRRDLGFAGPIQLYVGRVAIEKNIEAFLSSKVPGTKVVVGDGPAKADLTERFPDVKFLGAKFGEELAALYASADVFVFPSKTDTFGIVLLEAMASGVPVAAYPVMGPIDVVGDNRDIGCLHEDLDVAIEQALQCDSEACRAFAEAHSWEATAGLFLENIRQCRGSDFTALAA